MKQARHFAVHPGWKLIAADLGIAAGDLLTLAELPADLFSRKDATLSPPEYFRLLLASNSWSANRSCLCVLAAPFR